MRNKLVLKNVEVQTSNYKVRSGVEDLDKLTIENDLAKIEATIKDKNEELKKLYEDYESEKENMEAVMTAEKKKYLKEQEEEALNYLKQAKNLYDKVLEEANLEKEKILESANKEQAKILEKANSEKEAIFDVAKEEGREEGKKEAMEIGEIQINAIIEKIERIVVEILRKRDSILEELKGDVSDVMLKLVRKVFHEVTEQNKETVLKIVDSHIDKLKTDGKITIRVNTRDENLVRENREDIIRRVDSIEHIDVVEDSMVEPGGCIIETAFTKVDATLGKQMSKIESTLSSI